MNIYIIYDFVSILHGILIGWKCSLQSHFFGVPEAQHSTPALAEMIRQAQQLEGSPPLSLDNVLLPQDRLGLRQTALEIHMSGLT